MELWQNRVLNTEWGGMNDVLFNLYEQTGQKNARRQSLTALVFSLPFPCVFSLPFPGVFHCRHVPETLCPVLPSQPALPKDRPALQRLRLHRQTGRRRG